MNKYNDKKKSQRPVSILLALCLTALTFFSAPLVPGGEQVYADSQTANIAPKAVASSTETANTTDGYKFYPSKMNDQQDATASGETIWCTFETGKVYANPWAQYDFEGAYTMSSCQVMWYDDAGQTRLPGAVEIQYWDDETATFAAVTRDASKDTFTVNSTKSIGGYDTYEFEPVTSSKLRLVIDNSLYNKAVGIVEWQVMGQEIPVTGIEVSASPAVITAYGQTAQLSAALTPSKVSNPNIEWSVSNGTGAATIDADGLLTPLKNGTVTVTAAAQDGSGVTGTLELSISGQDTNIAPNAVASSTETANTTGGHGFYPSRMNDQQDTTASGETIWCTFEAGKVYANPWAQYDFEGAYTMSSCQVMWYDDSGQTRLPGSVEIQYWDEETATFAAVTRDASKDTFTVNSTKSIGGYDTYEFEPVTSTKLRLVIDNSLNNKAVGIVEWQVRGEPILVTSIEVSASPNVITAYGQTAQLSAALTPSNASNPNVEWNVINGTGAASIDADGLLTPLKNGTVTVTATAQDGSRVTGTLELSISGQDTNIAPNAAASSIETANTTAGLKFYPLYMNDGLDTLADMKNAKFWCSFEGGKVYPNPWVQYDFEEAYTMSSCQVMWYDDAGETRLPGAVEIQYWDEETATFAAVTRDASKDTFTVNSMTNIGGYDTYKFEPVETTRLRMVIDNSLNNKAVGIVEWQVNGHETAVTPPPADTTTEGAFTSGGYLDLMAGMTGYGTANTLITSERTVTAGKKLVYDTGSSQYDMYYSGLLNCYIGVVPLGGLTAADATANLKEADGTVTSIKYGVIGDNRNNRSDVGFKDLYYFDKVALLDITIPQGDVERVLAMDVNGDRILSPLDMAQLIRNYVFGTAFTVQKAAQ